MNKFWHDLKIIVIVTFLMVSSFRSALWIVRELNGFSSPSSAMVVSNQSTPVVIFDDPNDILYWPSIYELQWFAQTKPDGLFRKISQDDYEAQRWEWYCEMSARVTWPEQEGPHKTIIKDDKK